MKLTIAITLITPIIATPHLDAGGIKIDALGPKFTSVQNVQESYYQGTAPLAWVFVPPPAYPQYPQSQ
jgi:hypothetical protein